MHDYWVEFAKVAGMHLLAVASPGPDFALVLKQSIVHGRRTAWWTSAGVGAGILVHVGYSLLGLGLLIRGSETWFNVVKYAGAAYIAWLGVQSLRARARPEAPSGEGEGAGRIGGGEGEGGEEGGARRAMVPNERGAFVTGFLTNALNPKATLFFISLFVMIVSPRTPKIVQAGYGLWMAVATAAWFSLVSVLFTQERVRRRFLRYGHWIDRALGVVLIGFAIRLAIGTAK